jgi:hypothetical protein
MGTHRNSFDHAQAERAFSEAVNMTASELSRWLRTTESRNVGWKGRAGKMHESVGHASGRWIVDILGKTRRELSSDDYAQMRRVVGFIRRHLAQRPANAVTSRWRYSLMNWGHDPWKD